MPVSISTPRIRIGINPISWSNDDLPALGGETPLSTALSEGKAIGYEGFELNGKFPKDAKGVGDVLRPYDLALVSGWY
ncbi:AP endonuclease, partial [Pseudomonas savastanoi pv. glycinea str. race 4]